MADQDDNQARAAAEKAFDHALRAKEEAMHRLIEFMDRIGWPPDEQIDQIETPPAQETDEDDETDANDPLLLAQYERLSELHAKFLKAKEAAQEAERAYLAVLDSTYSSATRH